MAGLEWSGPHSPLKFLHLKAIEIEQNGTFDLANNLVLNNKFAIIHHDESIGLRGQKAAAN